MKSPKRAMKRRGFLHIFFFDGSSPSHPSQKIRYATLWEQGADQPAYVRSAERTGAKEQSNVKKGGKKDVQDQTRGTVRTGKAEGK